MRCFRKRNIRNKYDVEPEWRKPGNELTTGYKSDPPATRRRGPEVMARSELDEPLERQEERQMATVETPPSEQKVMVKEMSWDPITRIVGSLGIHTEIDFANQKVEKCYSRPR